MQSSTEQALAEMRQMGISEDRIQAWREAFEGQYVGVRRTGQDLTIIMGRRSKEMPDELARRLGMNV